MFKKLSLKLQYYTWPDASHLYYNEEVAKAEPFEASHELELNNNSEPPFYRVKRLKEYAC
jgi:hypothetical protein